jgi:hypothetical protein
VTLLCRRAKTPDGYIALQGGIDDFAGRVQIITEISSSTVVIVVDNDTRPVAKATYLFRPVKDFSADVLVLSLGFNIYELDPQSRSL